MVTVFHNKDGRVYTYRPADDRWSSRPLPEKVRKAVSYPQHHASYDPEINVCFYFVASDSRDNGRMFVYRYKRRP